MINEPVLVDQPEPPKNVFVTALARPHAERRPIIPAALRSPSERRQLAGWFWGHWKHILAYHSTRTPLYAWRITYRAPVGAARLTKLTYDWVSDAEGRPLRAAAIARGDADTYQSLCRRRDALVKNRLITLAVIGIPAVAGLAFAILTTGAVIWALMVTAAVLILGKAGSPQDKPLLDRAVVIPQVRKPTSNEIIDALGVIGDPRLSAAIAKDRKNAVIFVDPIARDGGGWLAKMNLPPGVTCTDVMERRDRLAAALSRPLGSVWPEGNTQIHPGRLMLWVGDEDMATAKQPAWPLLKTGAVDFFEDFPFGTDPRGRVVTMNLMYSNLLIGSLPGAGKSAQLRIALLAAALDVRAEEWVFELKGTGDQDVISPITHRYGSGADDQTAEDCLIALRDLRRECARRAAVIKELPRELCPEHKTTSHLASIRSYGLHPLVMGIDECQELFSHPLYGKEAGQLAEKIIKLGRALGVILLLATQRPDKASLPTGVSANVGTRFCLRVAGQVENDMVLGTSMYKNGIRATMFTPRDMGVGYFVGGLEPQIVRGYYINTAQAESIVARARAMREEAGTLTGYAAGEEEERPSYDLLEDVLRVVNLANGERLWSETVCEHLAELRPNVYAGWTPYQLAAALKPLGVETKQIFGDGANRRGVYRSDLLAALEARLPDHALEADSSTRGHATASR